VVGTTVVKWDATHLTATYAREISDQIEQAMAEVGALP
jgi:hypothetical protein